MKKIVVDKFNAKKKFFKFIKDVLPGMRNAEIFKLIRKGIVKVDDKSVDNNYILKEGDVVIFYLADFHFEKKGKKSDNKFQSVSSNLNIVFEDKDLLVVNKPAGLLLHPNNKEYKNCISETVKAYLYKKNEYDPENFFTPSPAHRLDTNTSGVVVIPKNQSALKDVNEQFRLRTTRKIYVALIFGKIENKILITSSIDSRENKENKVIVQDTKILNLIPDKEVFIQNNKLLSATVVNPIKYNKKVTLAEIELWTGKKHQIRAQLNSIKSPLLGDMKYFTPESFSFSQKYGLKGYFLHGYKLKLEGYEEFVSPIPENFKTAISLFFSNDTSF